MLVPVGVPTHRVDKAAGMTRVELLDELERSGAEVRSEPAP